MRTSERRRARLTAHLEAIHHVPYRRKTVKPAARLDTLLKFRERGEQRAQLRLAACSRAIEQGQRALDDALARSRKDARSAGPVEAWELAEQSHQKSLQDVRKAKDRLAQLERDREEARAACALAQREVETVRRATDRERALLIKELERREQRTLEEMAALLAHER
jgi:flagellar export protein FliJ